MDDELKGGSSSKLAHGHGKTQGSEMETGTAKPTNRGATSQQSIL